MAPPNDNNNDGGIRQGGRCALSSKKNLRSSQYDCPCIDRLVCTNRPALTSAPVYLILPIPTLPVATKTMWQDQRSSPHNRENGLQLRIGYLISILLWYQRSSMLGLPHRRALPGPVKIFHSFTSSPWFRQRLLHPSLSIHVHATLTCISPSYTISNLSNGTQPRAPRPTPASLSSKPKAQGRRALSSRVRLTPAFAKRAQTTKIPLGLNVHLCPTRWFGKRYE
jgi:hypothetical protein